MAKRDPKPEAHEPGEPAAPALYAHRTVQLGKGLHAVLEPDGNPVPTAEDVEVAKARVATLGKPGAHAPTEERNAAVYEVMRLKAIVEGLAGADIERLLAKGILAHEPPPPATMEAAVEEAGKSRRQLEVMRAKVAKFEARLAAAREAGDEARVQVYEEALADLAGEEA